MPTTSPGCEAGLSSPATMGRAASRPRRRRACCATSRALPSAAPTCAPRTWAACSATRSPRFRAPVAGLPPAHWSWHGLEPARTMPRRHRRPRTPAPAARLAASRRLSRRCAGASSTTSGRRATGRSSSELAVELGHEPHAGARGADPPGQRRTGRGRSPPRHARAAGVGRRHARDLRRADRARIGRGRAAGAAASPATPN